MSSASTSAMARPARSMNRSGQLALQRGAGIGHDAGEPDEVEGRRTGRCRVDHRPQRPEGHRQGREADREDDRGRSGDRRRPRPIPGPTRVPPAGRRPAAASPRRRRRSRRAPPPRGSARRPRWPPRSGLRGRGPATTTGRHGRASTGTPSGRSGGGRGRSSCSVVEGPGRPEVQHHDHGARDREAEDRHRQQREQAQEAEQGEAGGDRDQDDHGMGVDAPVHGRGLEQPRRDEPPGDQREDHGDGHRRSAEREDRERDRWPRRRWPRGRARTPRRTPRRRVRRPAAPPPRRAATPTTTASTAASTAVLRTYQATRYRPSRALAVTASTCQGRSERISHAQPRSPSASRKNVRNVPSTITVPTVTSAPATAPRSGVMLAETDAASWSRSCDAFSGAPISASRSRMPAIPSSTAAHHGAQVRHQEHEEQDRHAHDEDGSGTERDRGGDRPRAAGGAQPERRGGERRRQDQRDQGRGRRDGDRGHHQAGDDRHPRPPRGRASPRRAERTSHPGTSTGTGPAIRRARRPRSGAPSPGRSPATVAGCHERSRPPC